MLNSCKHVNGGFSWHDRTEWLVPVNHNRRPIRQHGDGKKDLGEIFNLLNNKLTNKRTCIQAGGNIGIWPIRFSKIFDLVVTFEPEAINYECLKHNTGDIANIAANNYALSKFASVDLLQREDNNCESFYAVPGDSIKSIRIDDCGFKNVDLIYLDIEGSELDALIGAEETIKRDSPLIGVEIVFSEPMEYLESLGYEIITVIGNDVIMGNK